MEAVEVERLGYVGVFAYLGWLAWTCPCDPIFKCHKTEVAVLLAITTVYAGWRLFPTTQ